MEGEPRQVRAGRVQGWAQGKVSALTGIGLRRPPLAAAGCRASASKPRQLAAAADSPASQRQRQAC